MVPPVSRLETNYVENVVAVSLSVSTQLIFLKNAMFWDVMPCSLLKIYHNFGGTYCLQLQDIYERFEET
jgi:hypothetical protein